MDNYPCIVLGRNNRANHHHVILIGDGLTSTAPYEMKVGTFASSSVIKLDEAQYEAIRDAIKPPAR